MSKKENDTILVLSDLHMPYHHKDVFKFLAKIKNVYNPTKIINIGDEVDNHAMSFHDSDPDLDSAGKELIEARKGIAKLAKLFPKMELVESNHGSMHLRKAKAFGIPTSFMKSYNNILGAPKTWVWKDEVILTSGGVEIMFRHQFKKNPLVCAQQMGMAVVQGHFHEDFNIQYTSSPNKLLWAMTVGCLIDKKSLAFTYNKTNTKRPIIGCGIIIDGQPVLIPMILNKKSRWVGYL